MESIAHQLHTDYGFKQLLLTYKKLQLIDKQFISIQIKSYKTINP